MIAYKFRSGRGTMDNNGVDLFERDIQLLAQDSIYIPTVKQLNDPSEAFVDDRALKMMLDVLTPLSSGDAPEHVKDSFQDLLEKIQESGVYSLSREVKNELMWAYYASGHYGYAIIFDTEVLAQSYDRGKWGGMYEFDVRYKKSVPIFDISKIDNKIETLTCLVGTKSKAWRHEAEHRLVFDKGGKSLKIDYRAIKGFVFGCRMDSKDVDYVMKIFAGRELNYYQMDLKCNTYEFNMKRLSDRYPDANKYCPNKVEYNLEHLLESDKYSMGVGYKYRPYVENALEEVCREPFVIGISHIVVTEDKGYPHIMVWTNISQPGVFRVRRAFEYDIVKGELERVK
jgi:hypothetical protein